MSKKSILYHTNWANYGRNFQVKDIAIELVSDIAYAFFNIKDSGNGNWIIVSGDVWADFQNPFIGNGVDPQNTWSSPTQDLGLFGQFSKLYKNTNGSFKLTLAIGGWTWSANFSLAVRTASSRSSLAQSIVVLFQQWPMFSGVSIDWEYLSNDGVNYGNGGNVVDPSDSANFIEFVKVLRTMFNQQGWTNYRIALCCTAAPEKLKFDVESLVPLLDEWHVMTYDFASGAWTNTTSHQSNLMPSPFGPYSASGAVKAYTSRGVPLSKIFIGVPLYSRGFSGTNGLGSPASGPSPDTSWEAGVVDYKALPIAGAVEMWDDQAQAGYSYDANRKVMNTYDVPQATMDKCDYINQTGLGGVIIWESSADAPKDSPRSLLKIIHDRLLVNNNGNWDPTKFYNIGDVVSYQSQKYQCLIAHQSQPSWPPGTSVSLWTAIVTPPPANWDPTKSYNVGDMVTYQSNTYQCDIAHQSQASWPPGTTVQLWDQKSVLPLNTWDPTKFYNVNDVVTYNGITYQCTIAHQAQTSWTPDAAVALWKPISGGQPAPSNWDPTMFYKVGDVVSFTGNTYQCTMAHQSQASRAPGTAVPLWDLTTNPSPNSWDPTKFYNVGSIVSYQGQTYQCTIAHQSQQSWTPVSTEPLWTVSSS